MKKRPFFLPVVILITTITLGISVPGIILANRDSQANFSEIDPTPTQQRSVSLSAPPAREQADVNLQNCTYHSYHWLSQPDAWPAQVSLGGVTYTRADMQNISSAPPGDPAIDLLKEALIAIVNIYNGASQARIESTLVEADNWLSNHQADDELSQFNQQQASSFTSTLANFNNGRLFPSSCPDQIPLPAVELASEEVGQPESESLPLSSVANSPGTGDNQSQSNSTLHYSPPAAPEPTATPVPTQAPPVLTNPPPNQAPVQLPTDAPVPPAPEPPPQVVPPDVPPGNPEKDNEGRGNGNGNGNGNDNPGQGHGKDNNPGRGNDNPGQGNQGGDNDNPGQENKGRGNDNPGPADQSRGNDNPGEGKGNEGGGKDNSGKGNEGGGNDNSGKGNEGGGKDNSGKGNEGGGNGNGKGGKQP